MRASLKINESIFWKVVNFGIKMQIEISNLESKYLIFQLCKMDIFKILMNLQRFINDFVFISDAPVF